LAQGYVTAQDRLWQMDLSAATPTASWRRFWALAGAARQNAARSAVSQYGPAHLRQPAREDRARLDDYARGVNLFIAQHQDSLPPEFKLLFYRPQPWSGVDSVSIGLMMVQMLDTHWYEAGAGADRPKLNNPKLEADLYPVGSWRDHPPTGVWSIGASRILLRPATKDDDDDDDRPGQRRAGHEDPRALAPARPARLRRLRARLEQLGHRRKHTASGKPLLSNDMHLGLTEPNIWYMADLKRAGARLSRRRSHAARNAVCDCRPQRARGLGIYRALRRRAGPVRGEAGRQGQLPGFAMGPGSRSPWTTKSSNVRGGKDVQLDVQSTAHGPLLNPIFTKETRPIALKWTLYDPSLNALPLYQMNTASNWTEFSAR
jgi:penicillin G amidase